MPDNQTVSHSQSIFDQKNHFNFLASVQSKIEKFSSETYKISEQEINSKVLSVNNSYHYNENSKNGKNHYFIDKCPPGFYLLWGREEASPQTSQLPPPPQKKSFTEKNSQLFQIKIFFDDDFKESVKVTDVQKCDLIQPILNTIFSKFSGGMPLEGLKTCFSRSRG